VISKARRTLELCALVLSKMSFVIVGVKLAAHDGNLLTAELACMAGSSAMHLPTQLAEHWASIPKVSPGRAYFSSSPGVDIHSE
jgi:hypothetical protein